MSYNHLSITERELIAIYRAKSWSICQIARLLGRAKSTISRELARNKGEYLPSKAQARYQRRRKKCRPHKLLENSVLFALVKKLFLEEHYSPEQIANRLKLKGRPPISSQGNRGAIRKLRHKGRRRRSKGYVSNRGKIPISNELKARPAEANEREVQEAMVDALSGQPLRSIMPDRGREFQLHGNVTPMKIPTACFVSIFLKVTTSTHSATRIYKR